jgi:hypothetical protein
MAAADVDGAPLRWEGVLAGRTTSNDGWSLAVQERGGRRCPALLVNRRSSLPPTGTCDALYWRNDPMFAMPTDRRGPLDVVTGGRRFRPVAETVVDGRRIVVVELPPELVAQVIDPVTVASRR